MDAIHPNADSSVDRPADRCATDRTCVDSGCGCGTVADSDRTSAASRRGVAAGLLAVACAAACLAGPLALGGVAAVSGVIAGRWWVLVGGAIAAAVVGAAVVRSRGTDSAC